VANHQSGTDGYFDNAMTTGPWQTAGFTTMDF
jgi:hypothetical protein